MFGDRRGPMGAGPRTGRGLGYCNGYDSPGYTKGGPGLGMGRRNGRGFGRGYGRGYGYGYGRGYGYGWGAPYQYENAQIPNEKEYLKARENALESELEALKKRLSTLENESNE